MCVCVLTHKHLSWFSASTEDRSRRISRKLKLSPVRDVWSGFMNMQVNVLQNMMVPFYFWMTNVTVEDM